MTGADKVFRLQKNWMRGVLDTTGITARVLAILHLGLLLRRSRNVWNQDIAAMASVLLEEAYAKRHLFLDEGIAGIIIFQSVS